MGESWIRSEENQENINRRVSTHLQPVHGSLQTVNRIPDGAENAEHFQPEQEFALQEPLQSGSYPERVDTGCAPTKKVRVPPPTRIMQRRVDIPLGPLLQVSDIRVRDTIR